MNRLPKYLLVLIRHRRLIVLNALALAVVGVGVSFVLPKQYTAVAQLLPPSDEDAFGLSGSGILGSSVGGRLGRLARIGSMAGEGTASEIMVGIMRSRSVMDRVALRCSVAHYYRIKPIKTEAVLRQLGDMTSLSVGDEGIVRIRVEAKAPVLAAKIANSFVAELDSFMRTSNMNRGHVMREFLAHRLAEVGNTVALTSESLRAFQESSRVMAIDEETRAAIDAYADLKSEAYTREAALEAVAGVASDDNPYTVTLRRELSSFQDQVRQLERGTPATGFGVGFALSFERLPAAAAEYARRYRDYKIQEETYSMLSQQYEYAKVLEARNAPVLTVLDYAVPPQRKSSPKRTAIVVVLFVFGLLSSSALAYIMEYFAYLEREKPDEHTAWADVWSQTLAALRSARALARPRHRTAR